MLAALLQLPIFLVIFVACFPFLYFIFICIASSVLKNFIYDRYDINLGYSLLIFGIYLEKKYDDLGCCKYTLFITFWFLWNAIIFLIQPFFILIVIYFLIFDYGSVYFANRLKKLVSEREDFKSII